MKNFKKISIMALGTTILLGSTAFASTGTVTIDGLRMRKEASTDSDIVTSFNYGAQLEIVEETGDWYRAKYYDQYEGYVYGEYVKINGATAETPTPTPTVTEPEEPAEEPIVEEPTEKPVEEPAQEEPINVEVPTVITETPKIVYPITTTTKLNAKIYMLPLITSTSINEIEKDVEITVQKELNNWVFISYGEISGWARKYNINMPEQEVPEVKPEEAETKSEEKTPEEKPVEEPETVADEREPSISKGYINVEAARIRKGPSTDTDILGVLNLNAEVTINAETDEWYKIQFNGITGYVSKSLISENVTTTSRSNSSRQTETPEQEKTVVENTTEVVQENKAEEAKQETPAEIIDEEPAASANSEGQRIADFAMQYKGYAYVYGGTTPSGGFDCSGFVYYVYNSCGYSLSRSCQTQAKSGRAVTKDSLQPGDLVFFNNTSDGTIGHVAIYIGDGNIIHAATTKKGVRVDTIESGYYNTYYYSARRIV